MSLGSNNVKESKKITFDLNAEPVDDGNCDSPRNSCPCSICLELLVNTNDDHRTLVTLKCDHKFHLDCIGSAFNAKYMMQCPNCRQIEPGQWRYPTNRPIPDFSGENGIAEEEEINITIGMELCPFEGSRQHYSFENPNLSGYNIFYVEPARHEGGQQCRYIEYSFTIPQSSAAAGVPQNFIFSSHWITSGGEIRYHMPSNRMIFWNASEPGVIRGRHYMSHPFYDHNPFYRSNSSIVNAPVAPPYLEGSSIANSPMSQPYPNCSTIQLNHLPSLFGDLSTPVTRGHVLPSNPEQTARGFVDSRASSSGSNQTNNNGLNQFNVWKAEHFFDLEEQFEIEKELYFMIYGRQGGGGGSNIDGGRGGGGNGNGNEISGRN